MIIITMNNGWRETISVKAYSKGVDQVTFLCLLTARYVAG